MLNLLDWESLLKSVGVKNPNKCMIWAFGDNYLSMRINDGDTRWNERHGDIFLLKNDDLVEESLKRIGKAYLHLTLKENE